MHRSTRFRVLGVTTGAVAALAIAGASQVAAEEPHVDEANATPAVEVDESLRRTACENLFVLMDDAMGEGSAGSMTIDECLGAMSRDVSYCYDPAATVACITEARVLDDVLECKDACMDPPTPKAAALADGVESAACENLLGLMRADASPDDIIPTVDQCVDSVRTTAASCTDYAAAVACVTNAQTMGGVAKCEQHCAPDGG